MSQLIKIKKYLISLGRIIHKMICEHISIVVNDLEKSIEFYTKIFGYTLARKTETSAYLYLGTDLLEIMQSISPKEIDKPKTPEGWWKKAHESIGISHIGFRVDDMDKTLERLTMLGVDIVRPPSVFKPNMKFVLELEDDKLKRAIQGPEKGWWRIAYVADPDGIILEIVER
jgi:catechol 2,3-dioxygenase-like lactoylglutathione lyase family enzyme